MALNFTDENSVTVIVGFGSAGSIDFGSSTPSSSSCTCTMDGVAVNNGANFGNNTAPPVGNQRANGNISINAGTSHTITTGLSQYVIVNNDGQYNGQTPSSNIMLQSQAIGSFILFNYGTLNNSTNYSYL